MGGSPVSRGRIRIMKSQHKIIVGNWKMNPATLKNAHQIVKDIVRQAGKAKNTTVVVCPPFVYIPSLAPSLKKAKLGAQDMFHELGSAFTSQVSADILKNIGVSHVIIGHSERRKLGETDEVINKKVLLALKMKMTPIVCIGEDSRDEDGHYLGVIRNQLEKALTGVKKTQLNSIIIAYEPVWAIGAEAAMNARDVHEMTIYIKKSLVDLFRMKKTPETPILYGGAVDPTNTKDILTLGDADGLLIGRQSLDPKNFIEIIVLAGTL